jgi:predicted dienelactone hydrolase
MRSRPCVFAILMSGAALVVNAQDSITLHDSARNRDIPIKVYAPSGGARSLPLIVFSHGFGGNRDDYAYLGKGWSEAGYVVILPTHADSDRAALNLKSLKKVKDPQWTFDQQVERTADVAYVISSINQIEREIPSLSGRIDLSHIGASGHSEGAGTALLLGGATAGPTGGARRVFRDQRVSAVIAMSPQGPGEEGFNDQSWNDIRIPTMTMSGTKDSGVGNESPPWRVEPYQHMPPGDKYHALLNGARHLSFALAGPRFRSCILSVTTAFWDSYLKDVNAAKARIQTTGACMVSRK